MHQEYVTSFFGSASERVNPALPSVRFERLSFHYLFLEMFRVEDNRILVEAIYLLIF